MFTGRIGNSLWNTDAKFCNMFLQCKRYDTIRYDRRD